METKENIYRGDKVHDNIRYFLDAYELSFIIRLKRLNGLRHCGCRTAYSQEFNFKSFQLGRGIFYRCARKLESLKLLERKTVGRFTDYHLNYKNYNRLVQIASITNNVYALCEFKETEFILKKRSIEDVSDNEILELKLKGEAPISF